MSRDSERKAMGEVLAEYAMMKPSQLAKFLQCTDAQARNILKAGLIPSMSISAGEGGRKVYRVDPLDAAVFKLAEAEGVTPEKYWERHGEETVTYARRFIKRIRRLQEK